MNKKQMIALWIGAGVGCLQLLFPPWYWQDSLIERKSLGYAFILTSRTEGAPIHIDYSRMLPALFATAIVAAVAFVSLRGANKGGE